MARGMPPLPRYQHTMEFNGPARILIIYGGTDDKRNVKFHPAFYSDLGILDLTHFIWLSVQVSGFTDPRCLHSSCLLNEKFIIFGGLNSKGLLNSDICYINLNNVQKINFENKGKFILRGEKHKIRHIEELIAEIQETK